MKRKPVYREIRPGFLVREDQQVDAIRYYTNDTGGWSGWIVRCTDGSHSDPIGNRKDAVVALLAWPATGRDRTWDDPTLIGSWREARRHYKGV